MAEEMTDPRDEAIQEIREFLDKIDWDDIPIAWSDFGHRASIRNCLENAQHALDARDDLTLGRCLEEILDLSASFGIGALERYQEEIENWVDLLSVTESHKLFEAKEPDIYLPPVLVAVNDDLLRVLAKNPTLLYELKPRKFEELIAELFYKQGFDVQLTKATRDGGRDIIAVSKSMNISTRYLIECKRYAARNRVGIEFVHRLFGVKIAESANKAILATTSAFTKPALEFARSHIWDLELKDYEDIVRWLAPYA
jgi:restriction endonuclease Mrr